MNTYDSGLCVKYNKNEKTGQCDLKLNMYLFITITFLFFFFLLSKFYHLRRLVFDQSSQVQPISESRGGYRQRDRQKEDRQTDGNPCCNIG